MNRVNIYQLMTWSRMNREIFPFGISIVNSILSSLISILPSVALIISLVVFKHQYYYIPFLILINIFNIFFLIKCLNTNPGIIPQIVRSRQLSQQLFSIPSSKFTLQDCKYLIVNKNLSLYNKYCYECKIYRPPRTIHCSKCNHCVQKYDHHCPWLSMCVGKYNYIYFLAYIFTLALVAVYSLIVCIIMIVKQVNQEQYFYHYVIQCIVALISGFFSFPLIKLIIYHGYIITKNQTTNQNLKKTYAQYIKPAYQVQNNKNNNISHPHSQLFNQQSTYLINKNSNYIQYSSKQSLQLQISNNNKNGMKQLMLINRINDSTTSSYSVKQNINIKENQFYSNKRNFNDNLHVDNMENKNDYQVDNQYNINHYSMQTERNSVFSYLLQN